MFNSQCSILIRTEGGRRTPRGSDRSGSYSAEFLVFREVRSYLASGERRAIRHPLRLRIAHWELNIGQILGLMSSSEYCQVIFARALSNFKIAYTPC